MHILNPPDPVTDLAASPVGSQDGDIQLLWTAPRNQNGMPLDSYVIRYATYPAVNQGQANSWWSELSASEKQVAPAHAPGVQEFTTLTGFTLNTTYYFGIKSVDVDGQISPIDTRVGLSTQAQSQPLNLAGPPPIPTQFAGVALSTEAIQWSWSSSLDAGFYRLYSYPADLLIVEELGLNTTEYNLTPNLPLTRHLRAGNSNGLSPPTVSRTVHTLAAVPANFAGNVITFSQTALSWTANGNPAGTEYRLERSLDGIAFAGISTQTAVSYSDTDLSELTSYYYRVRAINGDGLVTAPTGTIVLFTPKKLDLLVPMAPAGLKGTRDSTGQAFTLIWEPVVNNTDGSAATDVVGYHIYRRTTLTGSGVRITPVPIPITAFADRINGAVNFYTIRAVDTSANESADSLIADSSPDANIIYIDADGVSSVMMPEAVNDLLRSAYNKYGVPLTITMNEEPLPVDNTIVRSINLRLQRSDNNELLEDLAFAKPQALVSVGYTLVSGQVGRGSPLAVSAGPANATNLTPDQLSMFWFNGVTWVKIGGTLDMGAQALRTKSSFLGNYQIRGVASSSVLTLSKGNVYPRLFSPNGDGLNDRVYFVLENPNNASVTGVIMDKDGRHVRTLSPPELQSGIGTTLSWDGKDDRGHVVPGGAYIYKIEGEGKNFTGTVGVAR